MNLVVDPYAPGDDAGMPCLHRIGRFVVASMLAYACNSPAPVRGRDAAIDAARVTDAADAAVDATDAPVDAPSTFVLTRVSCPGLAPQVQFDGPTGSDEYLCVSVTDLWPARSAGTFHPRRRPR